MAIPAVVCMKSVARSYMWWPGMDQDLEALAKSCAACKLVKSALMATPIHPWLWPEQPWQCIHVDYASPFRGKMFLMIVDTYSKWPESLKWNDISAITILRVLQLLDYQNNSCWTMVYNSH